MASDTPVAATPQGPRPNRPSRPRPWRRIRFKLFVASLTLLGIPWAAYLFVQETEIFLRDAQDQALRTTASLVANIMHGHDDAFHGIARADSVLTFRNLFLHELREAPQLDGYRDDWGRYRHNFSRLQSVDDRMEAHALLGGYGRHVYLLLAAQVHEPRYEDQGDTVDLTLTDRAGKLRRYRFQPRAPGWVAARPVLSTETPSDTSRPNLAIRGEWQNAADGYTLEVRLPRLFGFTLLFFAVTGLGLLGFASLLTARIIRLRNEVELALADGTSPNGSTDGDPGDGAARR